MTVLHGGAATDVGRVRSNNQDQLLVAGRLFAVADGMGGHAGGEVASLAAVEALRAAFERNPSADGLADAVRSANEVVWERAQEGRELRGMGTTLTAVALVEGERGGDDVLAVVNVGDSRAYLLRDGELEQLTDDHSVPEELRRAGRLTDAEAASHPQRNVLTRALGIEREVEVDCFQVTPYRGDRLVLSSDGLYNEVDEEEIAAVLRRVDDPEEAARQLVAMAKDQGGNDNITVVVVDVMDDGSRAVRASAGLASSPPASRPSAGLAPSPPASGPAADRRTAGPTKTAAPPVGAPPETASATARPPGASPRPPGGGAGAGGGAGGGGGGGRYPWLTLRGVVFVGLVVLVLLAAFGITAWYARAGYFVGAQDEEIVIFKGRPGGLLWFDPTVAERTGVPLGEVRPNRADDIRAGKEYGSVAAARRYVRNVTEESAPATATTLPQTATTMPLAPAPPPPPQQ